MQKGGVGKSTITANVAGILAERGSRVLVVDLDPQGHQAVLFSAKSRVKAPTVLEVLTNRIPITDAIMSVREGIDLVPSAANLALAKAELSQHADGHHQLKEALEPVRSAYDYVVVDTPPDLSMLTSNALVACDWPFVPFGPEQLSFESLPDFIETFRRVKKYQHPAIGDPIFVPNQFQGRTIHHREIVELMKKNPFGFSVWEPIKRSIHAAAAVGVGKLIYEYDRDASEGFEKLAERIAAL
jgi:chromosome partitioning protein